MQTATLSIRELKANPSWAIAQAQAGVSVLITSYRKVVAQLAPPPDTYVKTKQNSELQARMDAMTAKGFLIQPTQPRRLNVPAYTLPQIPGQPYQSMADQIIEERSMGW